MIKLSKHVLTVLGILVVFLGIPSLLLVDFSTVFGGDTDATASASVVLAAPSGEYVVLINNDRRKDEETLQSWVDFFEGREVIYIMEDIECAVAKQDATGLEMARSLQSRLPENQMTIRQEDGLLLLSQAEKGGFDILLLSKEIADFYTASTIYDNDNVTMLTTG